jgi:hypothetical protein
MSCQQPGDLSVFDVLRLLRGSVGVSDSLADAAPSVHRVTVFGRPGADSGYITRSRWRRRCATATPGRRSGGTSTGRDFGSGVTVGLDRFVHRAGVLLGQVDGVRDAFVAELNGTGVRGAVDVVGDSDCRSFGHVIILGSGRCFVNVTRPTDRILLQLQADACEQAHYARTLPLCMRAV